MRAKHSLVYWMNSFPAIALLFIIGASAVLWSCHNSLAQDSPSSVEVVDYSKLLPLLPEGPPGWTTDKPEGSTDDAGGFTLTTAHRDYKKGEADNAPIASISILDSAANPDYVSSTTAAWTENSSTADGYAKPVTIEGHPGYEAYEKPTELTKLQQQHAQLLAAKPRDDAAIAEVQRKIGQAMLTAHGTLWVMVAKRYFVQIETQGLEAKELQEWVKRIDLKKLAEIK